MTRDDVVALINDTPTEQVVQETEAELSDVMDLHPSMGFDQLVDMINEELDAAHAECSESSLKEE